MIAFTHRFTNVTLCEFEATTTKEALQLAVKSVANLRGANLYGADLHGANLYGADLRVANLRGADLRGEKLTKTPLFITNLLWQVTITTASLTIGCQTHTHEAWGSFSNQEISNMEDRASSFWAQWGEPLLAMCKAHKEAA